MKSFVLVAFLLWALVGHKSDSAFINLKAKLIARAKVTGRGFSVQANSVQHCLALCNKRPDQCDAVSFHVITGKCRLLDRCAPVSIGSSSPYFYFYSKRPQIVSEGFVFEAESGSCLNVARKQTDFATADQLCADQNGRLATLNTPALNRMAVTLLKTAGSQYAWIGLRDVGTEGDPTHSDGSPVSARGFFLPAAQQWRNATERNCWALRDDGRWAEGSCKGRSLFSICEVPPF